MHCSEMRFHATFISLQHITPHITIEEKTLNFCLQIILLTIHLKFVITKNSPSFSYYATRTWLIIYEHIFFGWAAYHKEHVTVHLIPEQAKTWPLWQVSLHLNSNTVVIWCNLIIIWSNFITKHCSTSYLLAIHGYSI